MGDAGMRPLYCGYTVNMAIDNVNLAAATVESAAAAPPASVQLSQPVAVTAAAQSGVPGLGQNVDTFA